MMDPTITPALVPTPDSPIALAVTDRTVQILTLVFSFLSTIILGLVPIVVSRLGKIHTAVNSNLSAVKDELATAVKTITAQSGQIETLRGLIVGGRRSEDLPVPPAPLAPPVVVVAQPKVTTAEHGGHHPDRDRRSRGRR